MPARLLTWLVLVTVLPTAELGEQVIHLVEHVLDAEAPDHSAHHDSGAAPDDEHGCTALVHLCACHHATVTAALEHVVFHRVEASSAMPAGPPPSLADLTTPEPAYRPPIA